MKLEHVDQLAVFYEPSVNQRVKVGRLALRNREVLFEYDPVFLSTKLELSPLRLPLSSGVHTGQTALEGLMGVFDDSLPDGWGRLLIDRRAAELGFSARSLSPLDRLALVGARSMGALVYVPETEIEDPAIVKLAQLATDSEEVLAGSSKADLERLIAVGGSPQGARPKVLIQISPTGEILYGAREIKSDHTAWLVKFRSPTDHTHAAALEHCYFLMARAAGIVVPNTQLLGGTSRNPGYFAIQRFDRNRGRRMHVHTLGGLLEVAHDYRALDYRDLLTVTRRVTRDERAVAEMFRRACFNVFAYNRDDHTRNFAFVMDERGAWQVSPAYDLTFMSGPGGEHSMLVCGEGRAPSREHLLRLANECGLRGATSIIDEVRGAIDHFASFADKAQVPARLRDSTASALGLRTRRKTGVHSKPGPLTKRKRSS